MSSFFSKEPSPEDKVLYRLGLVMGGIPAVLLIFCKISGAEVLLPEWSIPCPFRSLTGLLCPGCGGTRAVRALLRGELRQSFLYHPAVPFAFALFLFYMISQTLGRLSRGRLPVLRFRTGYLYGMLALILLQWIVKNAFLLNIIERSFLWI